MTRRSAAGALAVAAAIACTSRSEGAGFATVGASVTVIPLLVTLSLSTAEGLIGEPILARASVTNAGPAALANAALTLRADPTGLRVGGSNPRPLGVLGSAQTSTVSWQLCGLQPGSYVVLARATASGFGADSPAAMLRLASADRPRCPR
jgi:hypothetical protein